MTTEMPKMEVIEHNPRATRFFMVGIATGYFLCFIIGWAVGVSWPQIVARFV